MKARSIHGNWVEVPKERVQLRVSAYGFVVYEGKLLLMHMKNTDKYCLPGGAVEVGETLEIALQREVKEEAGIDVAVSDFFTYTELPFYYDPADVAWQNYSFFYTCTPKTNELTEQYQVADDESEFPKWVPLDTLQASQIQFPGDEVFQKWVDNNVIHNALA